MKILAVVGSPRRKSNSTLLLNELLAGAREEGAEATIITPHTMSIRPCLACEGCYKTGRCIVKDDFQQVYDLIIGHDALVLATPVYFGGVSAQAKSLVDRCQCFWALRDMVRERIPSGPAGYTSRRGVLIVTAGIDKPVMFLGPRITFEFIIRSLQGEFYAELSFAGCDEPGIIRLRPEALEIAREVGRRMALGLPSLCPPSPLP